MSWQTLTLDSPSATSFLYADLTPGQRYYYIVAAIDSNGNRGAWSQQKDVILPESEETLTAPLLRAEAGPGQVTLTWNAVTTADSYVLISYEWATSAWVPLGGVLKGTSFTHKELTAGTTYY